MPARVIYDQTTKVVKQRLQGRRPPPAPAGHAVAVITDAEYAQISSLVHPQRGGFAWQYDETNQQIQPVADARITATFSPSSVKAERGGAPVVVQITLSRSFTGTWELESGEGKKVPIVFAGTTAQLLVQTGKVGATVLRGNENIRSVSPLTIQITPPSNTFEF